MQTDRDDTYQFDGIQRDVSPLLAKKSDLLNCENWYTRRYGAKKVRFGYTQFLDNVDSSPVRELIFYRLPSYQGVLRISGSKTYNWPLSGAGWGSSVKSWTVDTNTAFAQMSGALPYLHLSNGTDNYCITSDGVNFTDITGVNTPKAIAMAPWSSRIFTDNNAQGLKQSAVSFNLNTGFFRPEVS